MRWIWVFIAVVLGACEPRLPLQPLPQLAAGPPPLQPFAVTNLMLPAGETMIWEVRSQGLTIGRAELAISETEVHSRFKTSQLASVFAAAKHEATTIVDRRGVRPRSSSELLQIDDETTRVRADLDGARVDVGTAHTSIPGGNIGQTLHTALGWLRAWASPDAQPGFLFVVHMGELYRLDIGRPKRSEVLGNRALEVECRAGIYGSPKEPIAMKVYLSADAARVPLRFEVTAHDLKLVADLVDHTP